LTCTIISSIKIQTGGLRVYSVNNTRGMELSPRNGGTFEAKGVHRERAMIHSWIGNNPWKGGHKKR